MGQRKKRVILNTDYPLLKTGLARNGRLLAEYLYRTGKYELYYFCCGTAWESPEYSRFPWKTFGTLPNNQQELQQICQDPGQARFVSYGGYYIDRVIKEYKPDIVISSNDHWAVDNWISKLWFDKINFIPHITLDSLPFLNTNIELLKKTKNYLVWAEFAEKESHRLGFNHVKTLTGMIDSKSFYKLSKEKKQKLRKNNNIPERAFVCGFVFRNQLRKECAALLEGFKYYLNDNSHMDSYLLLHTSFSEGGGWNIPSLCDELNIDKKRILTTYVCRGCKGYEIKSFVGENQKCPHCRTEGDKGQITANVSNGVTEKELNEIYNLMDVYCHPFNAGGLEMPIVEALYTELPLATVPYSSGETFTDNDFVYSLDISFNRQHGTQFKRAVINPRSITKFLNKMVYANDESKVNLGKRGREWALGKFSIEVVGKQWEQLLDSLPLIEWDYDFAPKPKNPTAAIENLPSDSDFIEQLYVKILCVGGSDPSGKEHWLAQLKNGLTREQMVNIFRNIASQDNQKNGLGQVKLEDILDNNVRKKLLLVLKESIGDLIYLTSLLKSFKEQYPDHDIYLATDPQYFSIFDGNKYIHKLLPYQPFFDSEIAMTGQGSNKGFFDAYCHVGAYCQRFLNYLTNNNLALDLTYASSK